MIGVCPGDVEPVKALEFGVYTALKRKEPGAGVQEIFAEDRPGVLVGWRVPVATVFPNWFCTAMVPLGAIEPASALTWVTIEVSRLLWTSPGISKVVAVGIAATKTLAVSTEFAPLLAVIVQVPGTFGVHGR